MATLEAILEEKLIEQLCCDESQWTYRKDIRNEEDLWKNFKYILEQNNKAILNDMPLSESEFEKIKNDVSHSSFYEAGKWLSGENGKVYVHIQRGNEQLHLLVMNNEHVAGGTSVYEVINQYQAFKDNDNSHDRDRRFDVTLLINGLPLIHIELKNKSHSYKEGFNQIKKYIGEGKFRGIFSNVQMFVVSNEVDTKYFSAARDTELNMKFVCGWLDETNRSVGNYLEFAKSVLRIPNAHEMVTKYTVLDNDQRKLLVHRPYQIHAINAMRNASKRGESGFIWHTTGSGKTMTSYKATRNLIMDIPSLDKTIFLIDRKDLDTQTKLAFQSYAENDTIDVDDTEHVGSLIKKLTNNNRQMIVTTRQKLQVMINKRLQEGTKEYDAIKNLRIAFVVDECHRAVTPKTKRTLEQFFNRSLWYGFTGTPIFDENSRGPMGDLPQTTEQQYGRCLHSYTIKEAIHDENVLGFMVETLGPKDKKLDYTIYETKAHMREVLDTILNKSKSKIGLQRGKGQTYEAMLTVDSIAKAQEYYDLLKSVKEGNDELKIDEEMFKTLTDFPKFAITYSVSENEESSQVNQDKMKESLDDYNNMFGTKYRLDTINAYNENLNDRLARKESKYLDRKNQLDLVIVVDRLLTGFDAPCLSTLFIDRKPMAPQNLIQAFSRTNRLFDRNKQFGQIVTFQYPNEYKKAIDDALKLYSRGGEGKPVSEDWEEVLQNFIIALKAVRLIAAMPTDAISLSKKEKTQFVRAFRSLDKLFAHLKAFSNYTEEVIHKLDFSEEIYEDYAAAYKNILDELKDDDDIDGGGDEPVVDDYELVAYNKLRIDFEYIVALLQDVIDSLNAPGEDFEEKIKSIKEIVDEFSKENEKLARIFSQIIEEIENDRTKYEGKDISVIVSEMRREVIDKEITAFAEKWFVDVAEVSFQAYNYRNGELPNESNLKEKADYTLYKEKTENPLAKFKFRGELIRDFKENLMADIQPLM